MQNSIFASWFADGAGIALLLLFDPKVFHFLGWDGVEEIAQATQAPVRDECDDPWHEERDRLIFSQYHSELASDPVQIIWIDCSGDQAKDPPQVFSGGEDSNSP